MGSNPSKMFDDLPESSSTKQTKTMQHNSNNNLHISMEFNSYVEACSLDVDFRALDSTLQARTDHVINALAAGVEVRGLSIDSLRDVTECLLEMNQQVVKVILDCKKDIWKNHDLFCLVEDYFENSLHTLDFCASLEKCLKRARDSQMLILVALQEFEEEDRAAAGSSSPTPHRYSRTLAELKSFKKAGDPFTEEFFHVFHSVFQHQMRMLEKLQAKKKKLDKKLKSIQAWRKLSSIIFATTFAAVVICSVVAAAMAAPPVAAALAAAASIPVGSVGKWIDSLLMKRENAVKGQKEVVNSLNVGTYITIKDLESIGALVDKLEVDIESMIKNAEFAVGEEEEEEEDMAVKIVVEEMKKKLDAFMKNVDDLGARADNCSRDIRRARTVVLQRIIKPPAN